MGESEAMGDDDYDFKFPINTSKKTGSQAVFCG